MVVAGGWEGDKGPNIDIQTRLRSRGVLSSDGDDEMVRVTGQMTKLLEDDFADRDDIRRHAVMVDYI